MSEENKDKAFQFRRAPSRPKKISEINPEKDIRVRILGRVIGKNDGTLMIDDGSSNAEIIVESSIDDISIDDLVRIFARVLPLEDKYELRAEIVQRMNKLNYELYRKIMN